MKKIKLLENLPAQVYKTGKYSFIIKQENNGDYQLFGYKWNHKKTFVISKWENEIYFSDLDCVKEMINYLISDRIF